MANDEVFAQQEQVEEAWKHTSAENMSKEAVAAAKAAEAIWHHYAKRRKPTRWLELIEKIHPEDLRVQVASIIWWDFFGGKPWKHLNKYKDAWHPQINVEHGAVRGALIDLGFPERIARRRLNKKEAH